MAAEEFSMREIAEMLLQLTDAPMGTDLREMGIIDREYIGQSIHKLYLDRDTLIRVSGRMSGE